MAGRSGSPDFYVLAPPAPVYVKRDLAKLRAKQELKGTPVKEVPMEPQEEEEEKEEEEAPEIDLIELKRRRARGMYCNTQNEREQAVMLETCTRLRETPCKWFSCGVVLNSLESLVAHLHEVHAHEDELACVWDLCGKVCGSWQQLALHAETHALAAIPCAYQDCNAVRKSPYELMAHNLGHVQQNGALLPSARPTAPPQEALPLPPVPERVPMWEVNLVLAPVAMPDIPKDRHLSLGPWVLRNICAPATHVRTRRYYAAAAMPSSAKQFQPDYEFVETSSLHYSFMPSRPARVREMADLDSKDVTEKIMKGQMVLWPPGGADHQFNAKPEVAQEGENRTQPVPEARGQVPSLSAATVAEDPSNAAGIEATAEFGQNHYRTEAEAEAAASAPASSQLVELDPSNVGADRQFDVKADVTQARTEPEPEAVLELEDLSNVGMDDQFAVQVAVVHERDNRPLATPEMEAVTQGPVVSEALVEAMELEDILNIGADEETAVENMLHDDLEGVSHIQDVFVDVS
ncbi:hypothetical protein C8R47DRAFT_1128526 [Mycena vitilis]|nr:hypothetical protein C8R47DRAFT_1128526 [Mycena vitilis]